MAHELHWMFFFVCLLLLLFLCEWIVITLTNQQAPSKLITCPFNLLHSKLWGKMCPFVASSPSRKSLITVCIDSTVLTQKLRGCVSHLHLFGAGDIWRFVVFIFVVVLFYYFSFSFCLYDKPKYQCCKSWLERTQYDNIW